MPASSPRPNRERLATAAARTGISHRTLRNWVKKGTLPAYRVGPKIIEVDPADVDALINRPYGGSR